MTNETPRNDTQKCGDLTPAEDWGFTKRWPCDYEKGHTGDHHSGVGMGQGYFWPNDTQPETVGEPGDTEHLLRNLLAIIHSDGGHHSDAVGLAQSVVDAQAAWYARREPDDVLAAKAARYEETLERIERGEYPTTAGAAAYDALHPKRDALTRPAPAGEEGVDANSL